jgi:colanic acid/amylovoran biosynthesis glycosyltransferase
MRASGTTSAEVCVRIAFLVSEFPTFSETFVLDQIGALLERGHDVEVFPERPGAPARVRHPALSRHDLLARSHFPPPMPSARLRRAAAAAGLLLTRGRGHLPAMLRAVNPLTQGRQGVSLALLFRQIPLLGSPRYDVVHCHHGPVGLVAARLRRLGVLRGPLIASFHGFDANVVPGILGRGVYRPLFRAADLLTVNSEFLRARLLALGAPARRLVRLPVGVDVRKFRPAADGGGADREANCNEVRLLSVARLVEEKGIEFALRAVAELAPRFPGLRYQVVGDGPLRPALERLCLELGIRERVELLGAQSHQRVRELYARAHLFALPAVTAANGARESQGAPACALPVVASAVGGIPESLVDGRTGFLVPERDVAALADRVARLVEHPELRAAMGRAGRAFATANFDRNALADHLVSLYADVAARSAKRETSPTLATPRPRLRSNGSERDSGAELR